jgi:Zn-dependent peptidase ImmA (M78 family)
MEMAACRHPSPLPQSVETTSPASVSQTILFTTPAQVSPDPPSSFPGTIILRCPVIGLTLRNDRMYNFWFTIVHELAHLYLHLDGKNTALFDDTEQPVDDPGTDKLLQPTCTRS